MSVNKYILTTLLFACTLLVQARTYVVCVGISDYPGIRNDLRVSDNDAKIIQAIFEKNGHVKSSLILNQSATIRNICNELRVQFAPAESDDVVLFFFSGHGIPGGLCCTDGNLFYKTVFDIMKQCRAKNKIIMVDACFSGRMRTTNKKNQNYTNQNVMLFLSSRSNETSQETPFKNSLFTIFLERGLRGGADVNLDKVITAREIYNFVHNGVIQASQGQQHPVMWGKFNDNMTIIKW